MPNNKTLDTEFVHFELDNGILIMKYKPNKELTLDMAKKIVKTRLEFTDHTNLPLLILDQGVSGMSKEARDYFSSDEGIYLVKASSIVIDSVFGSFLVNFFLKVTNPKIPVKVFSDIKKAKKWLEAYK